ncbi:uncharacterized protein SCHCODRAFT_02546656 [Schizophyllum commune H4-8]|uniref:uncharacterized protein n=1 Tax=Schizophyllum commune (strain H4-8 / FGSC 9210) TaxID=578458 RepID=UPI00215F76A7
MASSADTKYWPLTTYDVAALKYMTTDVVVDFALYGVQATISMAAITILARRHGRSHFTLAAILGLFLSSTISIVANLILYLMQLPTALGTSERAIDDSLFALNILIGAAHDLNYILSDAVLVWRAWCLWPESRLIKCILTLCISGSVGGGIAECVWAFLPGPSVMEKLESNTQLLTRLIPLLSTNVVATVLIGTKVIQYRKEIKKFLGLFAQKTRTEMMLLLLFESGLVYIAFWVISGVLATVADDDPFSSLSIFNSVAHHVASNTTQTLLSAQVSAVMRTVVTPEEHEGALQSDTMHESQPSDPAGACDIEAQNSCAGSVSYSSVPHGRENPRPCEGVVEAGRESPL